MAKKKATKTVTKADGSTEQIEVPAVPYEPTDAEIVAKRAESLGQLTRDEAAQVLKAQAEHDAAQEAATEE